MRLSFFIAKPLYQGYHGFAINFSIKVCIIIQITSIPESHYHAYRLSVMFDAYKWDLQANEQSTISDKVLLMEQDEAAFLTESAVKLYHETIAMERALHRNSDLVKNLGISDTMATALCGCDYDPMRHVRFMRFDFHPTVDGWQISEVNSDVPAGYPEASVLPVLAQEYFPGYRQFGCFGTVLRDRLTALVPTGSTIAYLHDTHTVEDYQILHYIGDLMEKSGYKSMYASPEHIRFDDNGKTGKVTQEPSPTQHLGGIMRYFPAEWLEFTPGVDWIGFVNSQTPSCNHPIALLTQSKRLPLVWDKLGAGIPTWKKLLPETVDPSQLTDSHDWIMKPAFGRVGEGINIPGTIPPEEEQAILSAAQAEPTQWVAQKMFESLPVEGLHINVGVFVVDGSFAGFYARISDAPKIDEDASEIPILVRIY